ncbi:hypothetical protein QR680_016036 [Steinernema hermaphroditum]|uniref:C-type lectin domain-containing protein n=1 Tax=Steinernema hermaphroditum TaxID=289476 RepID=A0AA39H9T9_9BILA|nr:hypothetical protein QR680_016036 [Steinernema hermaphroditum]
MTPVLLLLAVGTGLAAAQCQFDYQVPSADGSICYTLCAQALSYQTAIRMCRNVGGTISMSQAAADEAKLKGLMEKKTKCSPFPRPVLGYWHGIQNGQCGITDYSGSTSYSNCLQFNPNPPKAAFICQSAAIAPPPTTAAPSETTTVTAEPTTTATEEPTTTTTTEESTTTTEEPTTTTEEPTTTTEEPTTTTEESTTTTEEPATTTTSGVIEEEVGNYLFVSTPMDWPAAKAYCEGKGTYQLTTFHKAKADVQVESIFKNIDSDIEGWWMGLQKPEGAGAAYAWVDASVVDYKNWGTGLPDDTETAEQCVVYWEGWVPMDCSIENPFVCENTSP